MKSMKKVFLICIALVIALTLCACEALGTDGSETTGTGTGTPTASSDALASSDAPASSDTPASSDAPASSEEEPFTGNIFTDSPSSPDATQTSITLIAKFEGETDTLDMVIDEVNITVEELFNNHLAGKAFPPATTFEYLLDYATITINGVTMRKAYANQIVPTTATVEMDFHTMPSFGDDSDDPAVSADPSITNKPISPEGPGSDEPETKDKDIVDIPAHSTDIPIYTMDPGEMTVTTLGPIVSIGGDPIFSFSFNPPTSMEPDPYESKEPVDTDDPEITKWDDEATADTEPPATKAPENPEDPEATKKPWDDDMTATAEPPVTAEPGGDETEPPVTNDPWGGIDTHVPFGSEETTAPTPDKPFDPEDTRDDPQTDEKPEYTWDEPIATKDPEYTWDEPIVTKEPEDTWDEPIVTKDPEYTWDDPIATEDPEDTRDDPSTDDPTEEGPRGEYSIDENGIVTPAYRDNEILWQCIMNFGSYNTSVDGQIVRPAEEKIALSRFFDLYLTDYFTEVTFKELWEMDMFVWAINGKVLTSPNAALYVGDHLTITYDMSDVEVEVPEEGYYPITLYMEDPGLKFLQMYDYIPAEYNTLGSFLEYILGSDSKTAFLRWDWQVNGKPAKADTPLSFDCLIVAMYRETDEVMQIKYLTQFAPDDVWEETLFVPTGEYTLIDLFNDYIGFGYPFEDTLSEGDWYVNGELANEKTVIRSGDTLLYAYKDSDEKEPEAEIMEIYFGTEFPDGTAGGSYYEIPYGEYQLIKLYNEYFSFGDSFSATLNYGTWYVNGERANAKTFVNAGDEIVFKYGEGSDSEGDDPEEYMMVGYIIEYADGTVKKNSLELPAREYALCEIVESYAFEFEGQTFDETQTYGTWYVNGEEADAKTMIYADDIISFVYFEEEPEGMTIFLIAEEGDFSMGVYYPTDITDESILLSRFVEEYLLGDGTKFAETLKMYQWVVDGEIANARTVLTDGCTVRAIVLYPEEEPLVPGEGEIKVKIEIFTEEMLVGAAYIVPERITFRELCEVYITEGELTYEEFCMAFEATVDGCLLDAESTFIDGALIEIVMTIELPEGDYGESEEGSFDSSSSDASGTTPPVLDVDNGTTDKGDSFIDGSEGNIYDKGDGSIITDEGVKYVATI